MVKRKASAPIDEAAGALPPNGDLPERPHMPPENIAFLEERLKTAKCFLEYGAGGSTRLAASLGVPQIVSVESDREFGKAVGRAVANAKSGSLLHMINVNVGATKEWGVP